MARFKIKNKGQISKTAQRRINRAIRDSGTMEKAAKILVDPMKKGKNPRTGKKYASLAKSTIESRRKRAKYNKVSGRFSPTKSNLTFSGQLLDSIKAKIIVTKSRVEIEPTGRRQKYKTKSGRPVKGKAISNKELARIHDEGDGVPIREILTVSKKNIAKIKRLIQKQIKKQFG